MRVIYCFKYGTMGDSSYSKTSCIKSGAGFTSTNLAIGLIKENTVSVIFVLSDASNFAIVLSDVMSLYALHM
jgi:hypothetical protein